MNHLRLPVVVLVSLFYTLALVVDRSAGVIYLLLVIAGVVGLVARFKPDGKTFLVWSKEYWPLFLAMSAPFIAVIVNQLVLGEFSPRSYDMQFRLALFFLLFWVMLCMPLQKMKYVQWGFVACAFLATYKIYVLTKGGEQRYGTDFIPIIIYAEMVLLVGVFCVFSIAWDHGQKRIFIGLKLAALCAGIYAAYLSQSRGVWVTMLIFGAIFWIVLKHIPFRYKAGVIAVVLLAAVASFYFSNTVKERLEVAKADIVQYDNGSNLDTSLGIRFQLWRGSWQLFKEHPVVGVGIEGYPKALKDLASRGIITPFASTFAHSHNEILFMMVRLGAIGLLGLLAVYFVPFYYFAREWNHPDEEVRYVAGMGMALTLGFFTLGLVEVIFLWWEAYPFYAVSVAFFLTYIIKRKSSLSA